MHDFGHAFRVFWKDAGFSSVAVLALALGIGANTAIFSVVNALFLRPFPYADAKRLVELHEKNSSGAIPVSYPNYQDWRKQSGVFEDMASSAIFDETVTVGGPAERLPVAYISSGFFSIFRARPVLGRDFTTEDDRPGATPVAILTHPFWQTRFAGNAAILGSNVTVDKRTYTVIGILPPDFHFYRSADLYIPISDALTRQMMDMRANHNHNSVVARLKPGATLEQAGAQMDTIARRLEHEYPDVNTGVGIQVVTLREELAGDSRRAILMLLTAAGLVLLIACANVANLLLARAADREKEMAIRAALGASRWRVLRQLLAESVLLAVVGGVLGILLASWSFSGLVRLVPASIAAGGLSIDARVLGFTLLVSVFTGVLFGLAPALHAAQPNLSIAASDGRRTTAGRSRGRLRDALVIAEVALALVLLVGAGLLMRTLNELMRVRLGFDTQNILTMSVTLPDSDMPLEASMFFDRLIERVQAMPGVESVGGVNTLALSGNRNNAVFYRDDRPEPPRGQLPIADNKAVTPGYFHTMRITLLKGRLFTPADGRLTNFRRDQTMDWLRKNAFAVVVNESMARRYWPGEDPVGKTFRFLFPEMNGPRLTIVGVVGDTRDLGPDSSAPPTFYWSACHFPHWNLSLVLRTRTEPLALASAIRKAAAGMDSSALVSDVTTVEQLVSESLSSRHLNMLMLAIFAGLALLLAAVGIYGVMAYSVNQRRHEIGVRMALGAMHSDVLRLVIGKALLLGGLGVVAGSAAALGLTRLMAGMLYGVKPADPLTFVCVDFLLFTVAVAASYLPARRATRLDPLAALRCE